MKIRLKPLKEQVMVITGATSGIGLATAKRAAERGARVVLCSRNESGLRETVAQIEESWRHRPRRGGRCLESG